MKKLLITVLCCLLISGLWTPVFAQEDGDKDEYYLTLCSGDVLSASQKTECQDYFNQRSKAMQNQLSEIQKKRKEIESNIEKVGQEISNYEAQISTLQSEINTLNTQIKEKEEAIAVLEAQIIEKEAEIVALKEKVAKRLERSQQTMRLNQFLDFMMGAEDFQDLLRRVQGVNDILNYDKQVLEELKTLMDQLSEAKEQVRVEKEALEVSKNEVEEKKAQVVSLKVTAELAKAKYEQEAANLEAQGNQISGSLSTLKGLLKNLDFDAIVSSGSFTKPASGRLSGGTWHYNLNVNGGVHLGIDIANSIGTPIRAAGNGIVIASADGCANDGHLFNTCGEAQGGSRGGGNQVYLLTNINGTTYAVKYLHMSPGSPVATGTEVNAGDQIGLMGKSGNVTASHVHVEIFRLGTMSIGSYANNWSGDMAFGAGWGSSALNKRCSESGAPCREKPESMFGY